MICIKKVELQITFFKKWVLKSTCADNANLKTYLKQTLRSGINIENDKITSLFEIKSFMGFCWLIMDSKHNLLSLNSNTPKKVIIIGIDIKQFYNKIIDKSLTNQVRLLNAYIGHLYGFKLYEDVIEEEIIIEPIKKDTMKEIIEPVIVEEKKVEVQKKEKPIKKQAKKGSKIESENKKSVVLVEEEKQKKKEEKPVKEEITAKEKVKKDAIKADAINKNVVDVPTNNDAKKTELNDETKKKEKPVKDSQVKNIPKEKKATDKKDSIKGKEEKNKNVHNSDNKETEKQKENIKESSKKKQKTKVEKSIEKKVEEKKQDDAIPEEILITLKLNEKENTEEVQSNNSSTIIVSTPKKEFEVEQKDTSTFINSVNEQKITFTVVSPNGEILYSKVVKNSMPMSVEELLKRTGLPIINSQGFIESIAGINNQGMSGWVYEVNGAPVMISASDYIVNPEDQITWKYISFAPIDLPLEEEMEVPLDFPIEEPVGKKMR